MRWRTMVPRAAAEATAVMRMLRPPRAGLRILMYHAVGSPVRGDRLGIFSVSPERFRCHVEILAKTARVHAVSLDPLHMPQHQLNVAVTFDDGYQDNLRVAAPILIENGIPFSVFVTTDFIRQATKGFLSPLELREITSLPGVTVGAHGRSHRSLTECSDQDLAEELTGSRQYLEDLLGCRITTVAYPHGAADQRVRAATQRAGYTIGLCSRFDINRTGHDPLMLSRCNILRDDSPRVLRQKLRGDWDWYRWRSANPLGLTGAGMYSSGYEQK